MLNIHLLSKLSLASHGDLSSFSTIPGPVFADSTSSTHLHNIDMSVFNSLLFRTNSIYSPIFPVDCLDVSLPSPGLWYLFDDHFNVFFSPLLHLYQLKIKLIISNSLCFLYTLQTSRYLTAMPPSFSLCHSYV